MSVVVAVTMVVAVPMVMAVSTRTVVVDVIVAVVLLMRLIGIVGHSAKYTAETALPSGLRDRYVTRE